ncbi:hypothetical protein OAE48_04095 [Flavobacteriales bacterium]|nr:hypothetical protein [Flavobacteriales bacterium]
MEILITSKTHKGKAACVGGLVLSNKRFVRLLNPGNWDQYADTDLDVGDVWDIHFADRADTQPPHVEDIIIQNQSYVRDIGDISSYLRNSGVRIYNGEPTQIFGGRLKWTGIGSGFIGSRENLPENSVGFWISDENLELDDDGKHYNYPSESPFSVQKRFKYVGFEETIPVIPAGTLMRVSLARWWKPEDVEIEERCYLQLSGWYIIKSPPKPNLLDDIIDDLPF